jgi:predicted component of type VI protein secretion system
MIETAIAGLEVQTEPEIAALEPGEPTRYLVLGDFGAHTLGVRPVDPETLDGVLDIVGVEIAGSPIREIEDFHPDRLYQRPDLFRDLREVNATERMRELLHHPRFQTLESAWRGLDFAVRRADDESASIYMAQYAREDLAADMAAAADLKTTRLYELFHAHKWGGIFGLYSFGPDAADIEILGRVALIAEQARAPFIAQGAEDTGPYWEELRSIPEAGYLALALPRFLLRLPYGARTSPIESFEFEEMPETPSHHGYLWGHPAWACLYVAASAREGAARLDLRGLPLHTYQQEGVWACTPCTEVAVTEAQARTFTLRGLIPLVWHRNTGCVSVAGLHAINGRALAWT